VIIATIWYVGTTLSQLCPDWWRRTVIDSIEPYPIATDEGEYSDLLISGLKKANSHRGQAERSMELIVALGNIKLLGSDKGAVLNLSVDQATVFVESERNLDPFKAMAVPHQCFAGNIATFVVKGQTVEQIQAGFDHFAAPVAADVNPIDAIAWPAATGTPTK
jgi:hypothetical protein